MSNKKVVRINRAFDKKFDQTEILERTNKLKPCPFCGSFPAGVDTTDSPPGALRVRCVCGAEGPYDKKGYKFQYGNSDEDTAAGMIKAMDLWDERK